MIRNPIDAILRVGQTSFFFWHLNFCVLLCCTFQKLNFYHLWSNQYGSKFILKLISSFQSVLSIIFSVTWGIFFVMVTDSPSLSLPYKPRNMTNSNLFSSFPFYTEYTPFEISMTVIQLLMHIYRQSYQFI